MSEVSANQTNHYTQLLEEFSRNPDNPMVWAEAYDLVTAAGDDSGIQGGAQAVPADELIGFADTMHNTPEAHRYALTTDLASSGERWFDILTTFSSPQLERAKQNVIEQAIQGGYHFDTALDIGTGTGKSLAVLESVAQHVYGIDRNSDLLAIAATSKASTTQLIQGDVTNMPFSAGVFDLIASSGVSGSLDKQASIQFYTELARVLRSNGMYIDGSYLDNKEGYEGKEMTDITTSPKTVLADMIVDSISGKLCITDYLSGKEREKLFGDLGLQAQYLAVEDPVYNDGTISAVTVITKH